MSAETDDTALHIDWKQTQRGFMYGEFTDRYGKSCSIQESSLATEGAIWLGMNENEEPQLGMGVAPRMHLTQDQVAALLPVLQHFADTGRLPWPDDDEVAKA